VPTTAEAGIAGLDMPLFTGLVAPAGTPREIVERLSAELQKILVRDDIKESIARSGFVLAERNTPAQFRTYLEKQIEMWDKVAKASKARLD
jgi:tripartite-type tricarboxylate transporter receptor subunit TctC